MSQSQTVEDLVDASERMAERAAEVEEFDRRRCELAERRRREALYDFVMGTAHDEDRRAA